MPVGSFILSMLLYVITLFYYLSLIIIRLGNWTTKVFFRQKTIAKKIRITLLRFSMSLLHKKAKDEFA